MLNFDNFPVNDGTFGQLPFSARMLAQKVGGSVKNGINIQCMLKINPKTVKPLENPD